MRRQQEPRLHHWPLGDSHMPLPSPPHLLPFLSTTVCPSRLPGEACWGRAAHLLPPEVPGRQRSSGRKLGEGGGHFLWLPRGDGQGQHPPPPPRLRCQPHSLPESGLWSSSSKATQAAASHAGRESNAGTFHRGVSRNKGARRTLLYPGAAAGGSREPSGGEVPDRGTVIPVA